MEIEFKAEGRLSVTSLVALKRAESVFAIHDRTFNGGGVSDSLIVYIRRDSEGPGWVSLVLN